MELKKIAEDGNRLKIRIKGEGHTFCNLLRRELWNTGKVKTVGYYIEHPQVGDPEFTLDAQAEPKKLFATAAKEAKQKIEALKKQIEKL